MRTILQLGILVLCFAGCNEYSTQPLALDPYERWKLHNLHSYTIDQTRGCFCPFGGETMRITVSSDTITSVSGVSENLNVPMSIQRLYLTVDSLFAIIHSNTKDSLVVVYDETYGYPAKLDINPQLHPVDGGVLYQTSNLRMP